MGSDRYILHAYVCGRDCVRESNHVGAMTCQQIMIERPSGCRYAVVEQGGKFMVWDLYDIDLPLFSGPGMTPPPPVRVTDDVDSAIVATAMLYNDE